MITKRLSQLVFLPLVALLSLGQWSDAQALDTLFGEGPKPLPVEEAFASTAELESDRSVSVQFTIEQGYYLYRDKLKFTTKHESVRIGAPVFSDALTHDDEFFGTTHIYRNQATIQLPLTRTKNGDELTFTLHYQGCADIGICYPPSTKDITLQLPSLAQHEAAGSIQPNPPIPSLGKESTKLTDLLNKTLAGGDGADNSELLTPQQAFIPNVEIGTDDQVDVNWTIEKGYYLYRDKLKFELLNAPSARINRIELDDGIVQNDAFFGDVAVYRETASAKLSITQVDAHPEAMLNIHYQGCADIGVCYPPETIALPVPLLATANDTVQTPADVPNRASVTSAVSANAVSASAVSANTNTQLTEQDKLTALLSGNNTALVVLTFFIAGLLLAFTACMYPMIPILSSLIVGQGKSLSTFKAFNLSLVYVVSMASVYAIAGVLVGLSGFNIQPLFQNPWVLSAFALLFVILALSMFGVFELQMPNVIQQKLVNASNKRSGGKWFGVATMGMLSALIVGPCVTAPLVAALAFIAKTGDAFIGGIALFSIGMGMGTPLLLIGTSAGKLMPKAGSWMSSIQRFFGVVLLGVAVSMLSRFLPAQATMVLSGAVILFGAVLLGLMDKLDQTSTVAKRLGKTLALLAALYAFALLIGALAGSQSFRTPLKGLVGQSAVGTINETASLEFQPIKGLSGLQTALQQAKSSGQTVMLDFYADWCVSCKEMEAFTFTDSTVINKLSKTVLLKADVTLNDDQDKQLLKHFGLFGPPAILFFDTQGREHSNARVVGFVPAGKFSEHLDRLL